MGRQARELRYQPALVRGDRGTGWRCLRLFLRGRRIARWGPGREPRSPRAAGLVALSIDSFDNQIKQCCDRGCGVPLKFKGHLDSDEIYDVSPQLLHIVDKTKRPATQLHTDPPESVPISTDYQRIHR